MLDTWSIWMATFSFMRGNSYAVIISLHVPLPR
jgi:hypothetical protein